MQHSELGIAPSRSIFHTPTRYALQVLVRLPSDGTYRLARCLAPDPGLHGPSLAKLLSVLRPWWNFETPPGTLRRIPPEPGTGRDHPERGGRSHGGSRTLRGLPLGSPRREGWVPLPHPPGLGCPSESAYGLYGRNHLAGSKGISRLV